MPILADNKRARFDFQITDTWEAGLELLGPEVKSARRGEISLKEAFILPRGRELFLIGCHIASYKKAANVAQNPLRERRLLLKRTEIVRLLGLKQSGGLTIVPLKMYTKHHRIKLEIGLARGRKKYDKREMIKERDEERSLRRGMESD